MFAYNATLCASDPGYYLRASSGGGNGSSSCASLPGGGGFGDWQVGSVGATPGCGRGAAWGQGAVRGARRPAQKTNQERSAASAAQRRTA